MKLYIHRRAIPARRTFQHPCAHLAPAPDAETWPATPLTTVLFAQETPETTRVAVTTELYRDVTTTEVEALVFELAGMTLGWTSSFDALEALVK